MRRTTKPVKIGFHSLVGKSINKKIDFDFDSDLYYKQSVAWSKESPEGFSWILLRFRFLSQNESGKKKQTLLCISGNK